MEAKVKRYTSFDAMSISATFPSGANFKLRVNRNGETLELAFSNDMPTLREQMKTFNAWIKRESDKHKDWTKLFDILEGYCKKSNTGKELISILEKA